MSRRNTAIEAAKSECERLGAILNLNGGSKHDKGVIAYGDKSRTITFPSTSNDYNIHRIYAGLVRRLVKEMQSS